jgi:D-alanine-D-alanine ligase
MNKRLRVMVLCGGPSSEHEVSLRTAQMVMKNLDKKKYDPVLVVIGKRGRWKFGGSNKSFDMGGAIKKLTALRFDFVFIAMHGAFGEDGRAQALLEWIGMPYSGTGVLGSAMAMDKNTSNILYSANGLRVSPYIVLNKHSKSVPIGLHLPVVVKPVNGGSSVGVSIVKAKSGLETAVKAAFREDERVMVQEYVKEREFTCGVLEDKKGKPFALPPTEIIPKNSFFFDYRAKYKVGGSEEITPARLPKEKIKKLQALALAAHQVLNCRGMSRSDFILKGSTFYILETNTIPGMTETSLLPQAAQAAGINFPAMLDLIIAAGFATPAGGGNMYEYGSRKSDHQRIAGGSRRTRGRRAAMGYSG